MTSTSTLPTISISRFVTDKNLCALVMSGQIGIQRRIARPLR